MRKKSIFLLIIMLCALFVPISYVFADEQLQINKAMLSSGSDQALQIAAAKQLLLSSDPDARSYLLEVINNPDETKSIQAISLALIQSGQWEEKPIDLIAFADPLLKAMSHPDEETARISAEATVIYSYLTVRERVVDLLESKETSTEYRLKLIYLLRLHISEKEAIGQLIHLLNHSDPKVAEAAGEALQTWVPVGTDKKLWGSILNDLKKKSPAQIARERLVQQEAKVRELQATLNKWKQMQLNSIDSIYIAIVDSDKKREFLEVYLKHEFDALRIWALGKVEEWRKSPKEVPIELGLTLKGLLADSDAKVRALSAEQLGWFGSMEPATALLESIKVEKDSVVKLKMFSALGELCYADMFRDEPKIVVGVRIELLAMAGVYMASEEDDVIKRGAEVFRKIVEKNGIAEDIVLRYVEQLARGFDKAKKQEKVDLQASLLSEMSRLCEKNSHYNALCVKNYEKIFTKELQSGISTVRLSSLNGLINCNKANAFVAAKKNELYVDQDAQVRELVISLASQVGSHEDLEWLYGIAKTDGESSWSVLLDILKRSEPPVVKLWIDRLESDKIKPEKLLAVYLIAEKKQPLQSDAIRKLASYYYSIKEAEKARTYSNQLLSKLTDLKEKESEALLMLNSSLALGDIQGAGLALATIVSMSDIAENDEVIKELDKYINDVNITDTIKSELIDILLKIELDGRPIWDEYVKSITGQLAGPKEAKAD